MFNKKNKRKPASSFFLMLYPTELRSPICLRSCTPPTGLEPATFRITGDELLYLTTYFLHELGDSNTYQRFWRPTFCRLNYARLCVVVVG